MRFRKGSRFWLSWGLILAISSSQAAVPPAALVPRNVGILRLEGRPSPDSERAYALVEKRVQRWLENLEGGNTRASILPGSVRADELSHLSSRARVEREVGALWNDIEGGKAFENTKGTLARVDGLVAQGRAIPGLGPVLQRALLAKAMIHWRDGAREEARGIMEEAARLHPEGKLPPVSPWDAESMGFDGVGFDADLEKARRSLRRACTLRVNLSPSRAVLWINGFDMGGKRQFALSAQGQYFMRAEAPGYGPKDKEFRCGNQAIVDMSWQLSPGERPSLADDSWLTRVERRWGIRSLCLIEPREDEFRLYLYGRDHTLEEIPLSAPLRVVEVLARHSETTLPIATDAFLSLLGKHLPGNASEEAPLWDAPAGALGEGPLGTGTPRWYNNATFWWVTGGILGGIAVTYLLTREGAVRATPSPGVAIKIH